MTGTIYSFEGFETERIFRFQEQLQKTVGVPVQVQLTVVPAALAVAGGEPEGTLLEESTVLPSDRD